MTDVVVHRCELRIRRTRGWAWGASPDELIAAATRAIPQLLAARLPQLAVPDDTTVTIDRPVSVKIAATARQLAALRDPSTGAPDIVELRARIEAEVAAAVARAIDETGVTTAPVSTAPVPEGVAGATTAHVDEAELASADAPRRAVRAWRQAGALEAVLGRLEPRALARLHELLLGDVSPQVEPSTPIMAIVERAAATFSSTAGSPVERVQRRIVLAAAVVETMPEVAPAQLRAAVDRVLPLDDELAAGVAASVAEDDARSATANASVEHTRAEVRAPQELRELTIRSAVPFLLLASLRNAGWFNAAEALLALHRCEADAFALAAGIAARVLGPLERGWKRSYADRLAIAVFAGRTEVIEDAEIAAAAARLKPLLAALDAYLRGVIGRARRPVPLVLWNDTRGWYLLDSDGMVVTAAGAELGDVLGVELVAPVIVPARFASRDVFDRIDYANGRFITDAPPGRGETWRSFTGATRRLHTNDTVTAAGKLAAITAHLDGMLALAEELTEVLAERPALAREALGAFEATCTLAATAALADLGARLFPAEPTTPVLVLTRFRDLDGRVTFADDCLRVRVPLGRRHADLMKHGALGTFANVPWLRDRMIDLGGG